MTPTPTPQRARGGGSAKPRRHMACPGCARPRPYVRSGKRKGGRTVWTAWCRRCNAQTVYREGGDA